MSRINSEHGNERIQKRILPTCLDKSRTYQFSLGLTKIFKFYVFYYGGNHQNFENMVLDSLTKKLQVSLHISPKIIKIRNSANKNFTIYNFILQPLKNVKQMLSKQILKLSEFKFL